MKLFSSLLISLLMSVTAYAADVDGTWTGSVAAPQGEVPVTFTFKADDAQLTGTTAGLDGAPIAIKDGKTDGTMITFTVTFDFGGTPFVLAYKGVVSSDQIKMSADAAGVPLEFVLKKSKDAAAVDGAWAGSIISPLGEIPISFNFKADGSVLTGTTKSLGGTDTPIKDGKIDGNTITFAVSIDFGGLPFVLSCKGLVSSDQIKMSTDAAGVPFEFVVKKAK